MRGIGIEIPELPCGHGDRAAFHDELGDSYFDTLIQTRAIDAALPRLEEFILPAGTRAASLAHVCRTVARRAERACVALGNEEAINETPRQYLNRLSDLMFVLARVLNRMNGGDDVYWKSQRMNKDKA